ncbi:Protein kinase alk2 [Stygiomarasmius scandens]|uniref:Protein kinase alk2 n=1 Tax=Marasmiellus scandens TaxID=2682957 RepID=A0ABR1J1H3_9AGAR
MALDVPPGIAYLVKHAPNLLLPPTIVYALLHITRSYFAIQIQVGKWTEIWLYVFSLPMALALSVLYTDILNTRAAWRVGAVKAPSPSILEDPTPGGILSLVRMSKAFNSGYPADQLAKRTDILGYTFNMRVLFTDRIFTAEPEHIKAFLATQFDHFEKGEDSRSTLDSLLGTGVFAADGDLWKFHRSITRPFFNRDRISHFDIFDKHADDAIGQMKARFKEGYPVDFQDVVSRFTIDSATEFLFGQDIKTLSAPLPYPFYSSQASVSNLSAGEGELSFSQAFAQSFSAAQNYTFFRARFGKHWPLLEFWKDRTKAEMDNVRKFLDPILDGAVRKAKERLAVTGEDKEKKWMRGDREVKEGETLLDHLTNYTDDPVILRDEIMNLAVAGRDTTASILTFTVYMLSQHPDILRRLREEILIKIGSSRRPTYDDFRDMKYLRAVLNETLRLYPPVPFNMRQCKDGAVLPPTKAGGKPIYVPPGTRCAYSVFVMHRREDLWGPDVLNFDPDRFLDERVHKYLTPNPFIFLPFNAGPRICLGQQFAYHEASFFLVRLLQNFPSISLSEEAQPPYSRAPAHWKEEGGIKAREKVQLKSHLTMYIYEGLWLKMEESPAVEEV